MQRARRLFRSGSRVCRACTCFLPSFRGIFFFFFHFFLPLLFFVRRPQDQGKIDKWVADYKAANPTLTAAQIEAVELPDRPDWGSPLLKNCYFCAGKCWENALDNISCQVSMSDPFGNGKTKRSAMSHVEAMEKGMLAEEHPEVHKAIEAGNEVLKRAVAAVEQKKRAVAAVEDVEDVLEECTNAQLNQITIIIPGFGRRFHCSQTCLTQYASKAPTPLPTPHPNEVDPFTTQDPNGPPTFGPGGVPTNPPSNAPNPGASGININTVTNAANNNQAGGFKACSKDNEVCGMSGSTKLFCKCKLCGYKQPACPSAASTNAVSAVLAAVAALVAAARLI